MQRPIVRATQRDETAIAEWPAGTLPALKKARNEKRTLLYVVYVDDSAFVAPR